MEKLWTVPSAANLNTASLCEYSDEDVARILKSAEDYLIRYEWDHKKDNWDDERGSGESSGVSYFRISKERVLVCDGNPIGVAFDMFQERYGGFSSSYADGNHYLLFGDAKTLHFNCSYYIGSTDTSEDNRLSLVKAKGIGNNKISKGNLYMTGLARIY